LSKWVKTLLQAFKEGLRAVFSQSEGTIMRTKHLINLLADVQVEKVSTAFMYLYGIEDEHKLEIAGIAAQLSSLEVQLNNSIEVAGHSFLLNHYAASNLVKALNKKGFRLELTEEDKLSGLLVQILTSGKVEPFVADFVYHMIHKGYGQTLSAAEIKALNAALALIEDKLDL
jgi:predicted transcriptional regulator